jgi:predicted nucleic acid-binding protein
MIEFFDSTVLIAAMIEDEDRHEACSHALDSAEGAFATLHSAAECYATLTGGKLGIRLSPSDASRLIRQNIYERLTLINLTADECIRMIDQAGPSGARGGAIYDLLIIACARKIGAEKIYTLNDRHFAALAPDLMDRILIPS